MQTAQLPNVPMSINEMYADIVEWRTGRHDVISDRAAMTIVGEFEIDGTISNGPALRDEIICKMAALGHPIELEALLGWLYFFGFAERP